MQRAYYKQTLSSKVKVAYFCMEYALKHDFSIYSGGLGVLAADYLYEAHDRHYPILGVGLLYGYSYIQEISGEGKQVEKHIPLNPDQYNLTLMTDENDIPITIEVPLGERIIKVQAHLLSNNEINLLLLDTNIAENSPQDRNITDELYSGDKQHRLEQEIILGIGGVRMLHALELFPYILHMNEGHAGFLAFEQMTWMMKTKGLPFEIALRETQDSIVFTNHTLIPAGNDMFDISMVKYALAAFAHHSHLDLDILIELGKTEDAYSFSMTLLCLRCASRSNAVSHFHADKAKNIWPTYPLLSITNGIYQPRWLSTEKQHQWSADAEQPTHPRDFYAAHQVDKEDLCRFVLQRTGVQIKPASLIFTWARRFVQYKRPEALFWQLDWLENMIQNSPVPIHFLFSGKVHPHDTAAKQSVNNVVLLSKSDRFKEHITFIPNYNLEVAKYLVEGSDVWLNTPQEGFEACGTSGMKAALNGVLQCTTNDGWVREVDWQGLGWILDDAHISESLYHTIEHEIVPLYMKRDSMGYPSEWVERMIKSSQLIRKQYCTNRMIIEYNKLLYKNSLSEDES